MGTIDIATSTVCRCNRHFGVDTLHPLASVVNIDGEATYKGLRLDCYAVYMAERLPKTHRCTACHCDYTDAAVVFATPGRRIEAGIADGGRLLLFHPDLINSQCLGMRMGEYTFFQYNETEALRLSLREKRQLERCLDYIDEELHWGVDRFSATLICNKIELLLNYCLRYYCRQLTLRHELSQQAIGELTRKADAYLREGRAETEGLPSAALMAQWAGHSEAYTADMLRHETGFATAEYAAMRRMEVAKQLIVGTQQPIADIARTLGFPGEMPFRKLFNKCTGCQPEAYRD